MNLKLKGFQYLLKRSDESIGTHIRIARRQWFTREHRLEHILYEHETVCPN
jgi:hypothetical protein